MTETSLNQDLAVRPLRPEDDGARDAFVLDHPGGTLFHDSRWKRAIQRTFGHVPRDLGAFRDERLVGLLPLMRVPRLPRGHNLVSMPYGVYGGPLVAEDSPGALDQLLLRATGDARAEGAARLELRCDAALPDASMQRFGLAKSELYSTFVRQLPNKPEDVLAMMPKKARAEARKARKRHGLELIEGRWYAEDLYRMFMKNKRSLGSPGLPAKLFNELMSILGNDVVVHLVTRNRQPLSAVMSFAYRGSLVAYYSGTEPGVDRQYSASNFMYMALQEWAVERGFHEFDFCRSRRDSGAFQFKLHQGFEPRQLNYTYLGVKAESLPSFTPSNPRTAVLRKAWSQLPAPVAERLSPFLSRYLS